MNPVKNSSTPMSQEAQQRLFTPDTINLLVMQANLILVPRSWILLNQEQKWILRLAVFPLPFFHFQAQLL